MDVLDWAAIPWRDPPIPRLLKAAMGQRQRMWTLEPVADEVDELARRFAQSLS